MLRIFLDGAAWGLFGLVMAIFSLFSPSSFATYNTQCMNLMVRSDRQMEAFTIARHEWESSIRKVWKINRPLSDIEFEALMDVTHGLTMRVIFANGKRGTFLQEAESLNDFAKKLQQSEIVEVQHLPDANLRVGEILMQACRLLRKTGCEVYYTYKGMMSPHDRPFTRDQEQALKWVTIHMAPSREMADAYHKFSSPEVVKRIHARTVDQKQLLALYILMTAFGEEDGGLLHVGFVQNYINVAFERILHLYNGQQTH